MGLGDEGLDHERPLRSEVLADRGEARGLAFRGVEVEQGVVRDEDDVESVRVYRIRR
jgi:hypothetical protein